MKTINKILTLGISCFLLSSCFLTEKTKDFTAKNIHITLDNTFVMTNAEGFEVVFISSTKGNIYFYELEDVSLQSRFNVIDEAYELTDVYEKQDYKTLQTKDNLSYYEFVTTESDIEYYNLLTNFNNNIFCEVIIPFAEEYKTLYTTTVFEWLSSVTIDN